MLVTRLFYLFYLRMHHFRHENTRFRHFFNNKLVKLGAKPYFCIVFVSWLAIEFS